MLKKILIGLPAAFALLIVVLVGRALMLPGASNLAQTSPAIDASSADAMAMANRLGEAIRLETVSWGDREIDAAAFSALTCSHSCWSPLTSTTSAG
ncbi:MAG TPA: hypothetical protein PKM48_07265, partial [Parvularculaceae bacterium]|nr:hypothetical protein [Parvularculaceae bacterium]